MLTETTRVDPRTPLAKLRKIQLKRILKEHGYEYNGMSAETLRKRIEAHNIDVRPYLPQRRTPQTDPTTAAQVKHLQERNETLETQINELRREMDLLRYQQVQAGAPKGDSTYTPEQPAEKQLEDLPRGTLMKVASQKGIHVHNRLKRVELIAMIREADGQDAA